MPRYTPEEMADIHLAFGEARKNARRAKQLYAAKFPERRCPTSWTFQDMDRRLRETGTFRSGTDRRGRPRSVRTPDFERQVLDMLGENPGMSCRGIARAMDVDHRQVWETLKEQLLHPYRYQKVQNLKPADFPMRRRFCRWYLRKTAWDPNLQERILYSDEARFDQTGIFNNKNLHIWSDLNPHATWERGHQQRFGVNIWAGIVGNCLIGPVVLPNRLTGQQYLNFLQTDLPALLEEVPFDHRAGMIYQHDGAPPHFFRPVREYLDEVFPNRWIGRNGPVRWPARSPDLNPLDFFFVGACKVGGVCNPT